MTNRRNKKKKTKTIIWFATAFACMLPVCLLFSQEILTPLTANPLLIKKHFEINSNSLKKGPSVPDTITLPFLDDFSKDDIYPDATLWLDSNVFINRTLPIAPPTLGVATFDGVSKSGCPYDTTLTNAGVSLSADTLTSKPINLSLLPSDSVYFSFLWQAKGRGNDPEQDDSLALDFFNPTTHLWKNIWSKKGYNPSTGDTIFRLVIIPVTDTTFLKNAFQFRFRNKATVSGNVDHWHIDYVLLDKNRNMTDTVFDDVAFAYNCHSLLKKYYAMPWEQYQASEMKTNLDFLIRNNNTIQKNTSFDYKIFNNSGGTEATYTGGSDNCPPFSTDNYWNYPPITNPPIANVSTPYSYPSLTDSASFTIEFAINTAPDKDRWNDTLHFKQNFYNYYAYDDGTVEAGYGLNYYGGQIGYKFTLNNPDTLYALQMLFNWTPPKISQRQFRIRIWNDAGGVPGSIIFEDSLVTPKYEYQFHNDWGNLTNMFHPYLLTTPQKLSGTFYVGLIQYTTDLLNIGFDRNTQNNSNMFFNIGNGWSQSQIAGSWMIRPVLGSAQGLLDVKDQNLATEFNVYPNPTNGTTNVEIHGFENYKIKKVDVYDIFGACIHQQTGIAAHLQIDLSSNPNGIYFLRITDETGITHSQKLVLSK